MSWQRSCCIRFLSGENVPRKKVGRRRLHTWSVPGEPLLLHLVFGPDTADKLFQVNEVTITTLGHLGLVAYMSTEVQVLAFDTKSVLSSEVRIQSRGDIALIKRGKYFAVSTQLKHATRSFVVTNRSP
jgi:hypothetical protein